MATLFFTALYPSVCKFSKFNTCHPKVITKDFDYTLESYEVGVAQCKIHPPHKLFLPLLPAVSNGRLLFSLCSKCSADEEVGECKCTYDERCMQGCWTTAELRKALELGYTMDTIHEVYAYDETCQYDKGRHIHGLFSEFIDFFLK